jgi:competence protein ComEC
MRIGGSTLRLGLGGVGALAVVLFSSLPTRAQTDNFLRVNFIDVGQGDAIWVQGPQQADGTPGGNLIIDGGPDTGTKNRLLKYLATPSYGLKPDQAIDCIVATHPHDDHYPGLLDVLAKYQVRQIIDSGFPKTGPTFAAFVAAAKKETAGGKKSKLIELRKTTQRAFDCGSVHIQVLFADSATATEMGTGNTRENNASTVIRLEFGGFSFLFMGDAEGKEREGNVATPLFAERMLMAQEQLHPGFLHANVLKVAHHGSETSSTLPFMKAVNPDVLVVMSGRKMFRTRFLPDDTTLARYRKQNPKITIVRTDEADAAEGRDTTDDADGDDVYMYTDGHTLRVNQAVGPQGHRKWRKVRTLQAASDDQ